MEREENGRFAKGNSLGTGRPKGSRNKQTSYIRQYFADFIEKQLPQLDESFEKLEPKEKFKFLIDMAKFVIPNLKAIEFGNVLDELSEDDFQQLIVKLKEEYQLN